MTAARISCETCGGEGTVVEFHRFAGEYMAGEPVEVECPDCDGEGSWEDEPEEGDTGKTLDQVIAEHPELQAYRDELRARLWNLPTNLSDPFEKAAA